MRKKNNKNDKDKKLDIQLQEVNGEKNINVVQNISNDKENLQNDESDKGKAKTKKDILSSYYENLNNKKNRLIDEQNKDLTLLLNLLKQKND